MFQLSLKHSFNVIGSEMWPGHIEAITWLEGNFEKNVVRRISDV
jgi:hypothetical protein